MDREQILSLFNERGWTAHTVHKYCILQGKNPELSLLFIRLLIQTDLIDLALQYLVSHYEINILRNSQGETIMYL